MIEEDYREYLASFFTCGMSGMIIRVLLRRVPSEQEFIDNMITTFQISLPALIQARGRKS